MVLSLAFMQLRRLVCATSHGMAAIVLVRVRMRTDSLSGPRVLELNRTFQQRQDCSDFPGVKVNLDAR